MPSVECLRNAKLHIFHTLLVFLSEIRMKNKGHRANSESRRSVVPNENYENWCE